MNNRQLIRIGLIAVLALFAYFQKGRFHGASATTDSLPLIAPSQPSGSATTPPSATPLLVRNMTILDTNGKVAFRGDIDLAPSLERIHAGRRDPHENDGATFGNFEGKLPRKPRDYYREYVVRTPNIRHAGPQRLVLGQNGEIYYTPDHYRTFLPIRR